MAHETKTEAEKFKHALRRIASSEYRQREMETKRLAWEARDRAVAQRQAELDEQWRKKEPARRARLLEELARQQKEEALRTQEEAMRVERERQRVVELVQTSWRARVEQFQGIGSRYVGPCEWGHFNPHQLVRLAKARPPVEQGRSVTNFSSWVYELEHGHSGSSASLDLGKLVERRIVERDRARREIAFVRGSQPAVSGWKVLYEDDLSPHAKTFQASSLLIGGRPLVAKPDLVLEESSTGRVFIVERKASNITPPTLSWNNVRAQLWAYSWIDDWKDRSIRLCVEVWMYGLMGDPTGCRVISWDKGDDSAELAIPRLFEIYGGVFLSDSAKR